MTDFAYLGNGSLNTILKVTGDTPYTAGTSTNILIDNSASSSNFILNLPTAVGITGRIYKIRRTDFVASTNITIVTPNGSETIGGCALWRLNPAENLTIISNGTNWNVLDYTVPSVYGYYHNAGATADRRYICGLSYCGTTSLTTSTTLPAVDTLWALPFIVGRPTIFSVLSFEVTTFATNGVARMGIYRDNGNAYPGTMLYDSGSISTDTPAAIKNHTISPNITLQPGLHWGVWECGVAAPQIKILSGTGGLIGILGSGAFSTSNGAGYGWTVAHSFGSLPASYTAGGTLLNVSPGASNPVPVIALRAI